MRRQCWFFNPADSITKKACCITTGGAAGGGTSAGIQVASNATHGCCAIFPAGPSLSSNVLLASVSGTVAGATICFSFYLIVDYIQKRHQRTTIHYQQGPNVEEAHVANASDESTRLVASAPSPSMAGMNSSG